MSIKIQGNFTPNSFAGTRLSAPQTDFGPIFTRYTDALPAIMSRGVKAYGGKAIAFGLNRQFSTTNDLVNWSSTKLTPLVGTQANSLYDGEFDNQGNFKFVGSASNTANPRPMLITTSNVFDSSPTWTINASSPNGGSTNSGFITNLVFNPNTSTWFGMGNKNSTDGSYFVNTAGTDLLSCSGSSITAGEIVAHGNNFIIYQNINPVRYRIISAESPSYACALGTNVAGTSLPYVEHNSFAVNGTRIVSAAEQTITFSDNGTTFSLASTPPLIGVYRNVSYGNGVFIVTSPSSGGQNTPMYSVDNGETWNFLPDWDNGLARYVTYDSTTQNFISTNHANRDVVIFNSNAIKNL